MYAVRRLRSLTLVDMCAGVLLGAPTGLTVAAPAVLLVVLAMGCPSGRRQSYGGMSVGHGMLSGDGCYA
ncbi:hypothetical protein [Flindersiella endophytica]